MSNVVKQRDIICVICPNSCNITVKQMSDGKLLMEGQGCKRGETYATDEFTAPKRTLSTTVRIKGAFIPLLPVRSSVPVPKESLNDILDVIAQMEIQAPFKCGDVVIQDVLHLGADIIATRTLGIDTCTKVACELK
jgi:CxxC motif-containing protein